MLPTTVEKNSENNGLSRFLSNLSHFSPQESYRQIVSFFATHYDPRESQNWPALFSALTQFVSTFGGRDIQTMAIQNMVMATFASVSSGILKYNEAREEASPLNQTGTHTSFNSTQGMQLVEAIRAASSTHEGTDPENIVESSSRLHSASTTGRSSTTNDNRSTDSAGWSIFNTKRQDQINRQISTNLLATQNGTNYFWPIAIDIAKERFFDLILFSVACGYKLAGGPAPLSARTTNALVWDLLSVSQQGLAQALSYIMYRDYAYGITVLCSMAAQVMELMNKNSDVSMKAVLYTAMIGMVMGVSMLAINYMEHESVLAAGKAKRPNQEATNVQRQNQKQEFHHHLNSWEKTGSYPGGVTACQDQDSENKDMFSGHVSTLVIEAFSMYQLSKVVRERYPDNMFVKYLSRAFFAIGCAFAAETIATRVLGDCHTLESVIVASTKFNTPAIMAKFVVELLDLAITNPKMFIIAARGIWESCQKRPTQGENLVQGKGPRTIENPVRNEEKRSGILLK